MRVLHVIQQMDHGGAERIVGALVRGARDAGVDTAVVAADGALLAALDVPHFPLRLVRRRPDRILGAAADVRAGVRAFAPDVCHVHNPGVAIPAALATRRGRAVRALVTVHGLPDRDYRSAGTLLRWTGLPVVSCGPGVDEALRAAGVTPLRMVVNGVGRPRGRLSRRRLGDELGVPESATLLVTVGRLAPVKNQELAIRALSRLPEQVHLVVVGDGPARGELERLAVDTGTAARVWFAGARDDAAEVSGVADVYLAPSRSEGMPLALAEAMAAGRPVVATAVRGSRQLVDDGRTGLLVADGDDDAMAQAVLRLLAEPAWAAELGAAAAQSVAGFTESAMVGSYLDLYRELES